MACRVGCILKIIASVVALLCGTFLVSATCLVALWAIGSLIAKVATSLLHVKGVAAVFRPEPKRKWRKPVTGKQRRALKRYITQLMNDDGDDQGLNWGRQANDDSDASGEDDFDSSDDYYLYDDYDDDDFLQMPQTARQAAQGSDQTEDTIFYCVQMRFPDGFIEKIQQLITLPNNKRFQLDRRLSATKMGWASSPENFRKKMSNYRSLLPFADLHWECAVIPRQMIRVDTGNGFETKEFNANVVEQGMHFKFIQNHIHGEWYDITRGQWVWIFDRLRSNMANNVRYTTREGTLVRPTLRTSGSSPGPKGYVYVASFNWDEDDRRIIGQIINSTDIPNTYAPICRLMTSSKIGCAEKVRGRGNRGKAFVHATSQLTNTNFVAFPCPRMKELERHFHVSRSNLGLHTGVGEWFHLSRFAKESIENEYTVMPMSEPIIRGQWTRQREPVSVVQDYALLWNATGLITRPELMQLFIQGRARNVN